YRLISHISNLTSLLPLNQYPTGVVSCLTSAVRPDLVIIRTLVQVATVPVVLVVGIAVHLVTPTVDNRYLDAVEPFDTFNLEEVVASVAVRCKHVRDAQACWHNRHLSHGIGTVVRVAFLTDPVGQRVDTRHGTRSHVNA